MRNVEIKASVTNFTEFLKSAEELSDKPEVILTQIDTYFKVPNGRLKLRQIQVTRIRDLREGNFQERYLAI